MGKFIDLTGQRFGRWTVISKGINDKNRQVRWICRCDCGVERSILGYSLRYETTKSCGCLRIEVTTTQNTSHGGTHLSEYNSWHSMIWRCTNQKDRSYKNYGGRGIKVYEKWMTIDGFSNFLRDVGMKPSPEYSLDRINNDGDYMPGNVRWATRKEQAANKRPMGRIEFFSDDVIEAEFYRRHLDRELHILRN